MAISFKKIIFNNITLKGGLLEQNCKKMLAYFGFTPNIFQNFIHQFKKEI